MLLAPALPPTPAAPVATGAGAPARRWERTALGTQCVVLYHCEQPKVARAFEAAVTSWMATFEARYSRFRPDSLLSRLNASAGRGWVAIDPEMDAMLDVAGMVHTLTRGLLDVTALPLLRLWNYQAATPRVPTEAEVAAARRLVGWERVERAPGRVRLPEAGMGLDFGGWGKEYAVDAVAGLARAHHIERALVDFGHDLHAVGAAPGKPGWHVGLEDPDRPGAACWGSLAVVDRGVASSGDYLRGFTLGGRRYGHIVDPRTGRPVSHGPRQVTVVAPSCLLAGLCATAAFMLPPAEGLALIQEAPGCEGCLLGADARHQTRGFFHHVVTR